MGIKLPKLKKKSLSRKITKVEAPKYIYIPLISQNDDNITTLVKVGEKVYKGQAVGRRKGEFSIPIHSSVSGKVKRFEEHTYLTGRKVKCVVIENDFKESVETKKSVKKDISNYNKEEFIEIIKEAGIVGMGGSGFPTYIKYNTDKKINTLIINAVECEPYITADYMIIKEKCDEILETVSAIMKINNIDEAVVVIKKDETILESIFNDLLGTYLNIRLEHVKNIYPSGWERQIVKEVLKKDYNLYPIEIGCVVNNVSTIYAIYEALKYRKPLIERVVTFTGPMLKKPQNVLVKIGSPINVVIETIGGYKKHPDVTLVAGGPMMGVGLVDDDLAISSNLNCVLVLPELNFKTVNCLRCGKCIDYCPVKLCPVIIKDNLYNKDNLKKLDPSRCIECGICTYVCPSRIAIREIVKEAKFRARR